MVDRGVDVVLVGAGLANSLIALHLRQTRPALHIALFEATASAGGEHTWSFHGSDLTAAQRAWIDPLVVARWSGYDTIFPGAARTLTGDYLSITSDRFEAVLRDTMGDALHVSRPVAEIEADGVVLADGTRVRAPLVIDGRGPGGRPEGLVLGFQNFVGKEVRLARPHGLTRPIIMDASVAQQDGYRFVYVLPFTTDRVLVEDTHYVDRAALSVHTLSENVDRYIQERGWQVSEVCRQEQGSLPIVLAGDPDRLWPAAQAVPRVGLAGTRFHQTTGYSLPDAVRVAEAIGALHDLTSASVAAALAAAGRRDWREQGFYRLLNRMLFLASPPDKRWRAMQRFYGLRAGLIQRFYARQLTWADRARILSGKPPVPLLAAVRAAMKTHIEDFRGSDDEHR